MDTETKVEYKKTLNLPETTLAMRANATVRELEIQKFWEENDIYNKIIENKDKTKRQKDGRGGVLCLSFFLRSSFCFGG